MNQQKGIEAGRGFRAWLSANPPGARSTRDGQGIRAPPSPPHPPMQARGWPVTTRQGATLSPGTAMILGGAGRGDSHKPGLVTAHGHGVYALTGGHAPRSSRGETATVVRIVDTSSGVSQCRPLYSITRKGSRPTVPRGGRRSPGYRAVIRPSPGPPRALFRTFRPFSSGGFTPDWSRPGPGGAGDRVLPTRGAGIRAPRMPAFAGASPPANPAWSSLAALVRNLRPVPQVPPRTWPRTRTT